MEGFACWNCWFCRHGWGVKCGRQMTHAQDSLPVGSAQSPAVDNLLWMLLLLLSRFQLCPNLCDPMDGSPPGAPVLGILQARTLEWVAISFSNAWKWKAKMKSLSRVWLLATSWTAAHQALPPMGFSRQEYWCGVPLPSPWILGPNQCQSSLTPQQWASFAFLKEALLFILFNLLIGCTTWHTGSYLPARDWACPHWELRVVTTGLPGSSSFALYIHLWPVNIELTLGFILQHSQLNILLSNSSTFLTYMQSTSRETLGWKKHKLESRLPGEISITSDVQMTLPLWQKVKRN